MITPEISEPEEKPTVEQESLSGPTEGLTLEEDKELASLLHKWTGGNISTPVYTELAGMLPQPIVEVVFFRSQSGILETLLIPRPLDDLVWPGMYHTPGSGLRTSDFYRPDQAPLNGPFERIQHDEINNDFPHEPISAGRLYRLTQRGPEAVEIFFLMEPPSGPDRKNYLWQSVGQLSQNPRFIQHQLPHILLAAEQYNMRNLK